MQPNAFQPSLIQPGPEGIAAANLDAIASAAGTSFAAAVGELVDAPDNYESHWHYAREQKKRRAFQRTLRNLEMRTRIVAPLRSEANVSVIPAKSVGGTSCVACLASRADASVYPGITMSAVSVNKERWQSDADMRVTNVLDDLRDLEDMVGLYELLLAA